MKINRIDIEGNNGRYATIARRAGNDRIEVTILTPSEPNGRVERIPASSADPEFWSAAGRLQIELDGHRGTNGDIQDYHDVLVRFAD